MGGSQADEIGDSLGMETGSCPWELRQVGTSSISKVAFAFIFPRGLVHRRCQQAAGSAEASEEGPWVTLRSCRLCHSRGMVLVQAVLAAQAKLRGPSSLPPQPFLGALMSQAQLGILNEWSHLEMVA